jgi:SAM-dependent methyltransferase
MDESEFDRFADEYNALHARNIRLSGETPEFFAEYKIALLARRTGAIQAGQPSNAKVILDFGGGIGSSVPYFHKYFWPSEVHCLDVSSRSLAIGAARFPGQAVYSVFDGRHIPYAADTFDAVFVACVLHHVAASEHVGLISEMRRVLKPGGTLMIFEHNPFNPLTVRAVNTCPFDENAVLIRPFALGRTVREAGFGKPNIGFTLFFPRALRILRYSEPALEWLPLGAQYYVHAVKR